ncbi:MAG: phosphate regulon sensor histidine kinase PhoR [Salinisphaera sp.]|nr:phosphate regulon sensor histidine kinase PhoR [Salinisphaera sp.]
MRSVGSAWRREVALLAGWLGLATLCGLAFGQPLVGLCSGAALYLLWQLRQVYLLHRWLLGRDQEAPAGTGIWQEVFTALHRLKQSNRKRKRHLKRIVDEFQASTEALPDGAVVLDVHGRILWFNQAAAALLGLRSQQDRGQRIANLLRHPRFGSYLDAGHQQPTEIEIPSPIDDNAVVCLRVIPYGNNQRLLIARDVSAQKQMDATRRDFVANASHELRTPLTVLRGYLDMMQEEAGPRGGLANWAAPLHEMAAQSQRMHGIIEGLLRLARVEGEGVQQKQTLVDVSALVAQLLTDAASASPPGLNIETEIDSGLFLFGRAGELESIFSNLIRNAVQFTPEGGEITIRWALAGDSACFSVSDSGIGIAAAHIPRLTERFYRADASRSTDAGGTGLGLAIVKHGLEHHEAELEISSQPGQGSTFTCRFPAHRAHRHRVA